MIRRKIFAFLLTVLFAGSQIGVANASPAQTVLKAKTPIQHLVVLMQENHTFDNYFGTYPGADGLPSKCRNAGQSGQSGGRVRRPLAYRYHHDHRPKPHCSDISRTI